MPKEGSSGVTGDRNPMQSIDIKYQFNKIFPLLVKKEIAGKTWFDHDLGL